MKKFFLGCGVFIVCACSFGCSWFMLKNTGTDAKTGLKYIITGRTMDFECSGKDMATEMIAVPKGTKEIVPTVYPNTPEKKPTLYSYIGLNAYGSGILEGLNNQGLGISGLWLHDAIYQNPKNGDSVINLNDLGGWILGNFNNVEEIRAALEKTVVTELFHPLLREVVPLHFTITDKNGKSIAVEFLNGKIQICNSSPSQVMTNFMNTVEKKWDEEYDKCTNSVTDDGPSRFSIGGGSSYARHLRLTFANKFMTESKTSEKGIENAIVLLAHAKTSNGEYLDANNKKEPTRTIWSVIKDHNNLRIYYSTETDNDYHYVSFDDDSKGIFFGSIKKFPVIKKPEHKSENNSFK